MIETPAYAGLHLAGVARARARDLRARAGRARGAALPVERDRSIVPMIRDRVLAAAGVLALLVIGYFAGWSIA